VAVITLSLGFNGAATVTNLQNSQDLAPNFAGTLYGIINFVGTTSGFITPIIVAYFTKDGVRNLKYFCHCCFNEFIDSFQHSIYEWQHVFWVGAAAYIAPAFFYFIFGDGRVQKWNDLSANKKDAIDTHL
jgi:ACS family sodium-dependent inorganic phosphate cotransporter